MEPIHGQLAAASVDLDAVLIDGAEREQALCYHAAIEGEIERDAIVVAVHGVKLGTN